MRSAAILRAMRGGAILCAVALLGGCAGARDAASGVVRESFLSDKPPAAIASCIALGMSWAGLPSEMMSDGARTVVTFRQAEQVFATATIVAGAPSVVDLRGAFGARIRHAVAGCV